jgi:hypothetical protein
VNFLTHGFRVTADAIPATLLDLAARGIVHLEHRGPDEFVCRLGVAPPDLTPYEQRVVRLLHTRLVDGTVPREALTTGPEQEAAGWRKAFEGEVVADAQARGLSRPIADARLVAGLFAGALGAGVAWWLALPRGSVASLAFVIGAVFVLGAAVSRQSQRETPAGLAAAGRWLGVQKALREDEVFATLPPITVGMWKRYLAYGAALGVARGAVEPIPMGAESDTRAWSSYGGHWRAVRIAYPTVFPLGWGLSPLPSLLVGTVIGLVSGFALSVFAGRANAVVLPFLVPLGIGAVAAGMVIFRSLADLLSQPLTVQGEILRLRVYGDKSKRHFVAIDDGGSQRLRAFVVDPRLYRQLEQGEVVEATVTPHLRHVRGIALLADG